MGIFWPKNLLPTQSPYGQSAYVFREMPFLRCLYLTLSWILKVLGASLWYREKRTAVWVALSLETRKQCLRKILILIASGCVYFSEKCKIHVKRIAVYLLIHVVRFFSPFQSRTKFPKKCRQFCKIFQTFCHSKSKSSNSWMCRLYLPKLLEEVVVKLGGRLCFSNSCALQNCNAILKSFPNCRLSPENY